MSKLHSNLEEYITRMSQFLASTSIRYAIKSPKPLKNLSSNDDIDLLVWDRQSAWMLKQNIENMFEDYRCKLFQYHPWSIHIALCKDKETFLVDICWSYAFTFGVYAECTPFLSRSSKYIDNLVYLCENDTLSIKKCIKYDFKPDDSTLCRFRKLSELVDNINIFHPFSMISVVKNLAWIKFLIFTRSHESGKIFTFSGPDGCGKSTSIAYLSKLIQTRYRRPVIYKRLRPGYVPYLKNLKRGNIKVEAASLSESLNTSSKPYSEKPGGSLSSIVRAAIALLDYQIGLFLDRKLYLARGYFIVYDRFLFDFICDNERMKIKNKISKYFQPLFALFIRSGQNHIFLKRDVGSIWADKPELSKSQILDLNLRYENIFLKYSAKSSFHTIYSANLKESHDKLETILYSSI